MLPLECLFIEFMGFPRFLLWEMRMCVPITNGHEELGDIGPNCLWLWVDWVIVDYLVVDFS